MLFWISAALAQDCQHTPRLDVEAAAWAGGSPEYRQLAGENRRESIESLKGIHMPSGEAKAELLLRVADLYSEEGVDQLLSGEDGAPWFEKSLKLSMSILSNFPTYDRTEDAEASAIEALTWLGRPDEALAMKPADDHVRADLLWALGRFDEACSIHPEDDEAVEPHPVLAELQAARAARYLDTAGQIAWLQEHPQNPHAAVLRDAWLEEGQMGGLAAWFRLFPLDDAQDALSSEQLRSLAAHPGVHLDAPEREDSEQCERYTAAGAACLEGDPALAEPLTAQSGLTACLDVEVWLRSRPEPCP